MSEGPELSEAEALAAEHALGVLSGRDRDEAEVRMARDPAFAADVEAWRMRLAPLFDGIEPVAAPAGVWARIEREIPANDNTAGRRLRFWRGTATGSMGVAVAALVAVAVLASQGPRIVQVPAPLPQQGQLLSASAVKQEGGAQPLFVASYDPDRKALIVTSLLANAADRAHVQELWLIAGKDNPKSLGILEPGKSQVIALPTDVMAKMSAGAALAVSIEEPGGSKDPDGPTGPVIGVGKLQKL
jgi:anti-sigma-K factor RskA